MFRVVGVAKSAAAAEPASKSSDCPCLRRFVFVRLASEAEAFWSGRSGGARVGKGLSRAGSQAPRRKGPELSVLARLAAAAASAGTWGRTMSCEGRSTSALAAIKSRR